MPCPLLRVADGNPSYKGKKNAIALMLSTTLQPVMAAEAAATITTMSGGKSISKTTPIPSPKPKRNFFEGVRNTLRPRKSLDSNNTGSSSSGSNSCSPSITQQLPAQNDGNTVQTEVQTETKNKNADSYAMIVVASSDLPVEDASVWPDNSMPQEKRS